MKRLGQIMSRTNAMTVIHLCREVLGRHANTNEHSSRHGSVPWRTWARFSWMNVETAIDFHYEAPRKDAAWSQKLKFWSHAFGVKC